MISTNNVLDVKIELAIDGKDQKVLKRILKPNDYESLKQQVGAMSAKAGFPEATFTINYLDADNEPVVVEDNDDLQMAYVIAESLGQPPKIKFLVRISPAAAVYQPEEENKDEPVQQEQADAEESFLIKGKKKGKANNNKGIPRKALKNLIQAELEKQSKEVFHNMLRQKNLEGLIAEGEVVADEDDGLYEEVEHTNVECDGCGVAPIRGNRYKCSVCKNFDYCTSCEDRLDHDHPFLKIKTASGAPDVMVTIFNENAPNFVPTQEPCRGRGGMFRGMFRGQHRGRGGGRGAGRGGRGGGISQMINAMLEKKGVDKDVASNMAQQFMQHKGMGEMCGDNKDVGSMAENFMEKMGLDSEKIESMVKNCMENKGDASPWNCGGNGGKNWNQVRATIVSKPEGVLEAFPDQLLTPTLEIHNGTHWPWKQGCYLALDDEQNNFENLPIELLNVPIDQQVGGKQNFKMQVPLKVQPFAVADDTVYTFNLCFYGPNGYKFGERISIQLKVKLPNSQPDELEFYKLAMKLLELKLGTFDECAAALRDANCDEAKATEVLKQRKQ